MRPVPSCKIGQRGTRRDDRLLCNPRSMRPSCKGRTKLSQDCRISEVQLSPSSEDDGRYAGHKRPRPPERAGKKRCLREPTHQPGCDSLVLYHWLSGLTIESAASYPCRAAG